MGLLTLGTISVAHGSQLMRWREDQKDPIFSPDHDDSGPGSGVDPSFLTAVPLEKPSGGIVF